MKKKLFAVLITLVLVGTLLTVPERIFKNRNAPMVTVGAKNCTENRILGEIIALMIGKNTSLQVKRQFQLDGTFICFQALSSGDIDIYTEYTGTALVSILNEDPLDDPEKSLEYIRRVFLSKYQIERLNPLGFSNSSALFMRKEAADYLHIQTISDLIEHLRQNPDQKIAVDPEFYIRREFQDLQQKYHYSFSEPTFMDQALMYLSLANGQIDVGDGYSTDGLISSFNLTLLEDDQKAFPTYDAVPLIRSSALQKYPF